MFYRFDVTDSAEEVIKSDICLPVYLQNGVKSSLPMGDNILEGNLLTVGATRTGKTTFLRNLLKRLRRQYPEALFILFDPKRDFLPLYEKEDILCSFYDNDSKDYAYFTWNLLRECLQSDYPEDQLRELMEIIFEDAISSSKDPFFYKAAKEVMIGYCLTFIRRHFRNRTEKIPTNRDILKLLKSMSADQLRRRLAMEDDNKRIIEDFLPSVNGISTKQAQGVLACLTEALTLFVGKFAGEGQDTIHEFLQQSGKALFLEYDYSRTKSGNAFYRLFLKLVIQEKLSASSNPNKKVFLILDEAPIIGHEFDLINALHVGGGLGLRTILACQSTAQLINLVPEHIEYLASALYGGFTTTIAFRLSDSVSLEQIQKQMGERIYSYYNFGLSRYEHSAVTIQKESVVLSEQLTNLKIGEAYVKMKHNSPVKVKFIMEE